MSEKVGKKVPASALEKRLYGIELKKLRQVIEQEMKWEVVYEMKSPFLEVLRNLGFKMPARRRPGGPRRNVGKCLLAAWLRRSDWRTKEVARFLGLKVDKAKGVSRSWSQSAKRYTDDGERWLQAFKDYAIEVRLDNEEIPDLYIEGTPLVEAGEQNKISTALFKELGSIALRMRLEYLKGRERKYGKKIEEVIKESKNLEGR